VKRFLAAACLALAGCAELQSHLQRQPDFYEVISEAVELARAPATKQKAALAQAQREFAADSAPMQRVRLATLLATLPEPLHDDARALELLEAVVESSSPAGRFAAFLATHIAERQRLAREGERLAREGERLARELERVTKERANAEREHQSAEKERDKREEALRQQLEALRAIERGILEREERMRKKPGAKP
jgi:hypothetical protein